MSLVEQATKRLEELKRAGVSVPWDAAGLAQSDVQARVENNPPPKKESTLEAAMRRLAAEPPPAQTPAVKLVSPPAPAPAPEPSAPRQTVTLDLARLERSGHLVPTQTRSSLAEEFRHVKRPLLKNARSKEQGASRLSQIMVTSALPGEGKTFFSINLAMSMAGEIDTAVLLVDADVVRPSVPQRLGFEAEKGLLDVLTDPSLDLADVVLQTNVPKLSVLPAGTRNSMSTELLASQAMETLLGSLAAKYPDHVVIFDAPPLLLTSEAKVLASRIGQVVLVIETSKTPRSVVAQAFAAVEQCPVVLSVLNKAPAHATPLGYGYYYG